MSLPRIVDGDTIRLYENDQEILSIQESVEGGKVLVALKGELRSSTVHDLQDELVALTTVGMELAVDLSGVTYLSNAAQHAFLLVQQRIDAMGKSGLTLVKLPAPILREFEKTGLSELLMIE